MKKTSLKILKIIQSLKGIDREQTRTLRGRTKNTTDTKTMVTATDVTVMTVIKDAVTLLMTGTCEGKMKAVNFIISKKLKIRPSVVNPIRPHHGNFFPLQNQSERIETSTWHLI